MWTGQPTIEKISPRTVRVTGVSLAAGETGTISLPGGAGDIALPADPTDEWELYPPHESTPLSAFVETRLHQSNDIPVTIPFSFEKAGADAGDLLLSFRNDAARASGQLEIYVDFQL